MSSETPPLLPEPVESTPHWLARGRSVGSSSRNRANTLAVVTLISSSPNLSREYIRPDQSRGMTHTWARR